MLSLNLLQERQPEVLNSNLAFTFTSKIKKNISSWYGIVSVSDLDIALLDSKLQEQMEMLSASYTQYAMVGQGQGDHNKQLHLEKWMADTQISHPHKF